ncbi:nitroreductase family protein [Pacificibacter marinus]|uniref:Putative NAD(P)H nitroreductase n=1 Tax=Pacificibacter marinus TaxID=658057 RepID=A0A1Y5RAI1_9RHOB|nr:nitroreductase [Pacificibacter marinus]SEK25821.1 Nitroreductase [Pacificibacter marinus]SLN12869.1 Putative NAD(P)H nitroreductase YdjA [Pacificibacter marinus]
MPAPNQTALDFLLSRRSRPAKTLVAPAPDRAALRPLLTAAARTPDHGKLEPWRFIVLEKPALTRLSTLVAELGAGRDLDADQMTKSISQYANADLAVAVIFSPKPSPKIPEIEQIYSAGAACLALLNAALAAGWGANWLSGWASHDPEFRTRGLNLAPQETIAGFIHIGTEKTAPPERPRPDLDAITTWVTD